MVLAVQLLRLATQSQHGAAVHCPPEFLSLSLFFGKNRLAHLEEDCQGLSKHCSQTQKLEETCKCLLWISMTQKKRRRKKEKRKNRLPFKQHEYTRDVKEPWISRSLFVRMES